MTTSEDRTCEYSTAQFGKEFIGTVASPDKPNMEPKVRMLYNHSVCVCIMVSQQSGNTQLCHGLSTEAITQSFKRVVDANLVDKLH